MTSENDQGGIVYVLTNPAMPGLVKIGLTSRDEVEQRLKELYSVTGVPVPFECEYAARVSSHGDVEQALHAAFEPQRINPNREFFRIEPRQAIAILKLLAIEDVTPSVQESAEDVEEDVETRATIAKRSPTLSSFRQMGIPYGSELKSLINPEETIEVVDSKRVKYQGENYSLGYATEAVLGKGHRFGSPRDLWTYEGKTLREIHDGLLS